MQLSRPQADVYVPDGTPLDVALSRTTHLCLAAHQDDAEIFAYHGILACYQQHSQWFTCVIVTDGGGSSRKGAYASYTDEQIKAVRRGEQRKAAVLGEYSVQIQLQHSSKSVKDLQNQTIVSDLHKVLLATQPEIVYLHNPTDKHDTHIAVLTHCLKALRLLPKSLRPNKLYGGEVWRNLDWLLDDDKQALNVSNRPNIAASLVGAFDSQISGGKRYDLATVGRRMANATYFNPHTIDDMTATDWAMDLTPLIENDDLSLIEYTDAFVSRFAEDIRKRLKKFGNL